MRRLFLEADELGQWLGPHGIHERFQDHGAGLLLTLARDAGYPFDVLSLKGMHSWAEARIRLKGYDVLAMNVRSWRYPNARRAAELFRAVNPQGEVWAGGFHATVAPDEMAAVDAFDVVVSGEAEETFLALCRSGASALGGRIVEGEPAADLDALPFIDRTLWPKPPDDPCYPLESPGGWGPGKRALSTITSRRCPWRCSFCYPAERRHFRTQRRRSVNHVLAELQEAEARYGEFGTVLFHDSEFLMNRPWLEEFAERYAALPTPWPFWASVRADMMARWPDLVRRLHLDCNWHCFSIGLESGSQRVLDIMNKETTAEQNEEAIELVNALGREARTEGRRPPVIFANVMFGIPGETPEDAFATVRMLARIDRAIPSIAWYTPYPGNVLGDQIRAEGRSLIGQRYDRFPNAAKVEGVDYQFYADLQAGRYDRETGVNMRALMSAQGSAGEALA